jgi:peptidoglycan/LPS O-acetylase OafA/YrhL
MPNIKEQGITLNYRRDIDGLRAVAVLLVVFDHLHTRATGGYIGVDVFFVISGYLISSSIMAEMASGSFLLGGFYERRIRRILPALLVMLLAVTVLAYLYYVPSEIEAYARSLLAAIFSVSNMLFWHEAGYFDAPSAFKPLLHTWSLGVEEQFYIFFPLFLFVLRRWFPTWIKAAIWAVTLVTFAMACFWVRRDPTAAFFFAPLRAWELLIGTILSQRYLPSIRGKVKRNVVSVVGISLILVPALVYSKFTMFPGLTALPPCLGAALLIASGETGPSLIGRVLSWRPVVFVGLISYSLYLWHWPILAFQDIVPIFTKISTHSKGGKFGFMVVSLILATLSWRFVETPFRKGAFRPGRRTLFLVNGLAVFAIAAIALGMLAVHGMPPNFPKEALQLTQYGHYSSDKEWRQNVCFFTPDTNFSDFNVSTCLRDDPARKQFLLIGDSHAADLYPGLSGVFPELNISQANASFCPPLVTEPALRPEFTSNCMKLSKFIFEDYLLHHPVDTVLLSAFWDESQLPELGRTVAWIQQHGMKVVVFGPVIEFAMPLPRVLIAALRDHTPERVATYEKIEPRQLDKMMAKLARDQWKVPYVSVFDTLCTPQTEQELKAQGPSASKCPVYAAPGVPLLFDTNHFTAQGSQLYARAMRNRNLLAY